MLSVSTQSMPPFAEMTQPPAMSVLSESALLEGTERMRVLVADGDPSLRAQLIGLLRDAGLDVIEAEHGRSAFELATELRPQILIADWSLPEMSGLDLIRALRENPVGRGIYILILAEGEPALVEAFRSGVDDFMSKPLKPEVLAARMRAGQRVFRLQQELEQDRDELRRFAAELAVANRKLQQLVLTDALTGFPNRRYAMERMQQEWAVSDRTKRALSCMMVDVDQFKQINDTWGHDVGDRMLQRTAAALKEALRAQDVVCRLGGDEFLVICPDTTLDAVLVGAERLRKAVASVEIEIPNGPLKSSVSIGVAQRVASMLDQNSLKARRRRRLCGQDKRAESDRRRTDRIQITVAASARKSPVFVPELRGSSRGQTGSLHASILLKREVGGIAHPHAAYRGALDRWSSSNSPINQYKRTYM